MPTRTFFEGVFDEKGELRERGSLVKGRSPASEVRPIDFVRENICGRCPARARCALTALEDEAGRPVKSRHGLFGLLTPQQRHSIERRGGLGCPECGVPLDPKGFIEGWLQCDSCAYSADVPPVPDQGDDWHDRHTQLAERVVAWLIENVAVGETAPSPTKLSAALSVRKHDVIRVYEALVADHTLEHYGTGCYRRLGRTAAMRSWRPPYIAA